MTATMIPAITGTDILCEDLDLDPDEEDFFPLAATATAWETVKRKVKDAQVKGFMSGESSEEESRPTGRTSRFRWAGLYGLAFGTP